MASLRTRVSNSPELRTSIATRTGPRDVTESRRAIPRPSRCSCPLGTRLAPPGAQPTRQRSPCGPWLESPPIPGVLVIGRGEDGARDAFTRDAGADWAAALPLVLEKHGHLDLRV